MLKSAFSWEHMMAYLKGLSRVEELRGKLNDLKLIGLTGSPTAVTHAPLILLEGFEGEVREEDVAVIVNGEGNYIFAVCRRGEGINENLRVGSYSPGVAYVRSKGEPPSKAKESFHFVLQVMGKLVDDGLVANDLIIAPGSKVYLFDRNRADVNPLSFVTPKDCVLGGFLANSNGNWPVPLDTRFIPYHIGVFGATGSGKSRLARHFLIPLLSESGYGVLVFDWEGVDYAPYFSDTLSLMDFKIDATHAAELILRGADYFGYKSEGDPVPSATNKVVMDMWGSVPEHVKDGISLREELRNRVMNELKSRPKASEYGILWELRLKSGLEKIPPGDWELIYRLSKGRSVEEFEFPRPGDVKVIDMSEVSDELKLSFFSNLCSNIIARMRQLKGEKLNVALIIDEAPQYCPYDPKGLQNETNERVKDLCALGRKRGVCVVLLAQGMAGEIGVNAAVRRNINTLFIGQIHPLDLEEAKMRLSPYGIRPESLLFLEPGEFYFTGKMNPSPTPLLISFSIEEGA